MIVNDYFSWQDCQWYFILYPRCYYGKSGEVVGKSSDSHSHHPLTAGQMSPDGNCQSAAPQARINTWQAVPKGPA